MKHASRLEMAILNCASRRNEIVAFSIPLVMFFLALGVGLLILWAIFPMNEWPNPSMLSPLLFVATLAAIGLYLTTIVSIGTVFVRTGRFRLLQLDQTMREIQAMSWREFEDLVTAYFETNGYRTEHVGRDTADGGVDVVIAKGGYTWLVQCSTIAVNGSRRNHFESCWESSQAERRRVESLLHAAYSTKALSFAKANPELQLIGGEQLRDLVEETVRHRKPTAAVSCPLCGGPMRPAAGRFGPFLGCANFPACKGWRHLPDEATSKA